MGTKKGGARKGKPKGSRKAFDDTKDSKKRPSAAASRKKGVTTKKGMARKGTVAGSRLAFDDTKQEKRETAGQFIRRHKEKERIRKIEEKEPNIFFTDDTWSFVDWLEQKYGLNYGDGFMYIISKLWKYPDLVEEWKEYEKTGEVHPELKYEWED